MSADIPTFYGVINALIRDIAEERGAEAEELKQRLLAKIRAGDKI